MSVNRVKIVNNGTDKYLNIPVNMQWDFLDRDMSIDELEVRAIKEVTGIAADFEVSRFQHNVFPNLDTAIFYEFNFYDNSLPITANTVGNWTSSYLNEGFSAQEIYYFSKPFTKSFFKLDFYDTNDESTQQIYLSIVLPIQQGLTQTAVIDPNKPPVDIKKPTMILDSIGADKEGFYIYWLRNPDFIKIADGFGVAGSMVSDPKDLEKSIDIMLKHDGPYLLHVRVEKEENIFPMIQTGASVGEIRLE